MGELLDIYANPPEDPDEVHPTDQMLIDSWINHARLVDGMIARGENYHLIADEEFTMRGLEVPERE